MSEPKSRPLIMSGPMVLAYLAGIKTETRRLVHRGEQLSIPGEHRCRYGKPGDKLWFRETYALEDELDKLPPADALVQNGPDQPVWYQADPGDPLEGRGKWRSPLFMPRAFSRIETTLLSVRQEPLGAITKDGASAEGFGVDPAGWGPLPEFRAYWEVLYGPGAWDRDKGLQVWVLGLEGHKGG